MRSRKIGIGDHRSNQPTETSEYWHALSIAQLLNQSSRSPDRPGRTLSTVCCAEELDRHFPSGLFPDECPRRSPLFEVPSTGFFRLSDFCSLNLYDTQFCLMQSSSPVLPRLAFAWATLLVILRMMNDVRIPCQEDSLQGILPESLFNWMWWIEKRHPIQSEWRSETRAILLDHWSLPTRQNLRYIRWTLVSRVSARFNQSSFEWKQIGIIAPRLWREYWSDLIFLDHLSLGDCLIFTLQPPSVGIWTPTKSRCPLTTLE